MMPWFETKETNNGTWGIHWTMDNEDPDVVINGKQDLASFYHPQIGPYASGDPDVVDWQLGVMKAAGISGVFIDWPGTVDFADYRKNKQNAEAIIDGTQRTGLKFAVVYEDHNLNLAFVPDQIGQATEDMAYLQENYFVKDNYLHVDEKPLLMDFGPQVLYEKMWDQIFTPIEPKPAFLTLWNQHLQGGSYCEGEYAWVWLDFLDGLTTWYDQVDVPIKIGTAYPGFQPFYQMGGWGGPTWTIDYGEDTFRQSFELALQNTEMIQICTWNDYGEGTIIEPTDEFGTTFVDIIQQATGSKYTHGDFEELTKIYFMRKQHADNATKLEELRNQYHELMHKFD
ncbi:glycoprotein endo-alpha-1,2-mannosidase-like [Zophobas morio]|uniref:glycoprotein endo-alpha-1,2-mannosidase-like n=1 Tax=Zophobas morio TaxID=2755281 RepID=UPI0030833567